MLVLQSKFPKVQVILEEVHFSAYLLTCNTHSVVINKPSSEVIPFEWEEHKENINQRRREGSSSEQNNSDFHEQMFHEQRTNIADIYIGGILPISYVGNTVISAYRSSSRHNLAES